ncbi:signal peptidase I [Nocardioides sp. MAHUQ-72]|uniref:signal peptidase I n=1 Tax=unclassified Nocardioides TaxID=2615069 RepID=UPI00361EC7BA
MNNEDRDSTSVVDPDEGESRSSRSRKKKKHLPVWQETVLLLGIALVLAIVIKALFVQAFYIPSESMEPGLVKNDRILVQKVSYWGGGHPERGDVVVFKDPGDWLSPEESAGPQSGLARLMAKVGLYPSGGHLVKRVIGVEGDVITCCDKQGRISVNGQPLDEASYVKEKGLDCNGPMVYRCEKDWTAGPVPKGHVFVMGDNRGHSADSSAHMCRSDETDCVPGDEFVATDLVVGKVFVRLWPSDRFAWVHRPDTFADVPDPS